MVDSRRRGGDRAGKREEQGWGRGGGALGNCRRAGAHSLTQMIPTNLILRNRVRICLVTPQMGVPKVTRCCEPQDTPSEVVLSAGEDQRPKSPSSCTLQPPETLLRDRQHGMRPWQKSGPTPLRFAALRVDSKERFVVLVLRIGDENETMRKQPGREVDDWPESIGPRGEHQKAKTTLRAG